MIKYRICSKCGGLTYKQSCDICGADLQYYDECDKIKNVKYAVRYGYQYRKEAIMNVGREDSRLHFCLPPVNEVLLWLGNVILSGITFEALRAGVKFLKSKILDKEIHVECDEETEAILNNDDSLLEFYNYIGEYNNGLVHLPDEEYKYIYEEMMTDFSSEEVNKLSSGDFFNLPQAERIEIIKEADKRARERIGLIVKRNSEK